MSKNLCPENNITFENSQTIRFETPLPAGTYTASAIVESTDTDSSSCLMLFYYADNNTLEVYIGRSSNGERVSKTFALAQDATKVRIYASEGYNLSVGDTGTFTKLQIEAGDQMTEYVPYGEVEEVVPEPTLTDEEELIIFYKAWCGETTTYPEPTCRETMLIKKVLDASYELPFTVTSESSPVEQYLWDFINGTNEMANHIPASRKEFWYHAIVFGSLPADATGIFLNNSEVCVWLAKVYYKLHP